MLKDKYFNPRLFNTRVLCWKVLGWKVHSWEKFKIILIENPERKLYYFMVSICILNLEVVVFSLNFCNTAIIWQFFCIKVSILNFSKECHYLQNKVGVVNFTKAHGLVKFQSFYKIYYSHFILEVMYHCWYTNEFMHLFINNLAS